jgi:hypothetical protein
MHLGMRHHGQLLDWMWVLMVQLTSVQTLSMIRDGLAGMSVWSCSRWLCNYDHLADIIQKEPSDGSCTVHLVNHYEKSTVNWNEIPIA